MPTGLENNLSARLRIGKSVMVVELNAKFGAENLQRRAVLKIKCLIGEIPAVQPIAAPDRHNFILVFCVSDRLKVKKCVTDHNTVLKFVPDNAGNIHKSRRVCHIFGTDAVNVYIAQIKLIFGIDKC